MKSKVITGMMLTLLLTSMLTIAFNVPLIVAETSIAELPGDYQTIREADGGSPTNSPDSQQGFLHDASENLCLDQSASVKDDPRPCSVDEDNWGFNETNEWADFANVDGDSVELVIGVNDVKPNSYESIMGLIGENGGESVNTVSMAGEIWAVVADIPLVTVSYFVEKVRAAELSRYIEPNIKFQACLIPNDPYWPLQWGPVKIEADYAWNTTIGDPSVLVAVIDTGIDWNHPDLAANYVPIGYDWVNNDTDPMDDHGHGTHCAGIIAAVINNSIGIAGLAQISVMAEKGLDSYGGGYEDDLANAIVHAVDQGADILSNSWGGYGESALIREAVKYAYDHDVLVVAAAGNEAWSVKLYPAAYDEVVAVTATDQYDDPAGFTNYGEWVELAAPGVDIYSTIWDNSYATKSGTSMACPHVAGVAALVWSWFPNTTRDWVRLWLRYTADDLGDPGFDVYYGYGRVNARKAVEETQPDHDLLILNWERPPYVEPAMLATINTTVLNFGASNETDVTVQLLVNGSIVDSALIGSLATCESATVSCSWSPTVEGMYNVTSCVAPVHGETTTENNVVWAYVYVGFAVKAVVLDSAGNYIVDIISNWEVLNTNWHLFGNELIYIDYTTLSIADITYDDIAATGADVLIISCAYDWEFTDSEIDAITQYVREGHGLVATAGTLYYGVPNNNKLAPLFGLNEAISWYTASTDLLHIQDPMHPLLVNLPNPYTFPLVGTACPSDGEWDWNELIGGTYVALGHYEESAIVAYRGLVYVSPWLEIIPPYYHFHLQLLYNAITWSSYQKPEHELIVSLDAPKYPQPGESILLNATVSNMGLNNETEVALQLLINDTIVDFEVIPELLTGSSYTLSYLWTPSAGIYSVTAYAPPLPGEEFTFNNIESAIIGVCYWTSIFVTEDNWPIPSDNDLDYYMFNNDPKHPIEWAHWYDLSPIVLIATLQLYVYDVDSPDEVNEVYLNDFYIGRLEGIGGQWMLNSFMVPSSYLKWGFNIATVYVDVTHPGAGNWATEVDWANLTIGYLPTEHELAVSLEVPTFLKPGGSSLLNATVHNLGLNDETSVELYLLINGTAVNSTTISELLTGAFYTINYLWTPTVGATYNVTAYAPPVPSESITANNVHSRYVIVSSAPKILAYVQYTDYDQEYANALRAIDSTFGPNYLLTELWDYTQLDSMLPGNDILFIPEQEYTSLPTMEMIGWRWSKTLSNFMAGGGTIIVCDFSGGSHGILTGAGLMSISGVNYITGLTVYLVDPSDPLAEGVSNTFIAPNGALSFITAETNVVFNDGTYPVVIHKIIGPGHIALIGFDYYASNPDADRILGNAIGLWVTVKHDVAIISVMPSAHKVLVGDTVDITVVAENQGGATEDFIVTAYADSLNSSRIYLDPSSYIFNTSAVSIGYKFNVTVKVEDVEDMTAWQVCLFFDPTIINVTRWYEPTWDPEYVFYGMGMTITMPTPPSGPGFYTPISPTNACAAVSAALFPKPPTGEGFYGDGKLCILQFEITAVPPQGETYSCDLDIEHPFLTFYIQTTQPDKIPFDTYVNGLYWLSSVGPPPPPPPGPPYTIGTIAVADLAPGANITITFTWNTTDVLPDDYKICAEASVVQGETDTADNTYTDGTIKVTKHPFANFTYSPPSPKPGETVTFNASASTPDGGTIISYDWDFGDGNFTTTTDPIITHIYATGDLYNVTLKITDSDGLTDSTWEMICVLTRDVAVVDVTPSTDRAYVGHTVNINVTVTNEGELTETLDVILYYNITAGDIIGTQAITDLLPGENRTLTFLWNTESVTPCMKYTIWAEAVPVPFEIDLEDNIMKDCEVKIKLVGDVNGDGYVDMADVSIIIEVFGSYSHPVQHPDWNPDADLNQDGWIDMADVSILIGNFGKCLPT